MIIGTGIDICEIRRIEKSIQKFNNKLELKICSENELLRLSKIKLSRKANKLAQMFAAKEATSKALGTGISNNVFMKNISTDNDTLGKPTLSLSGGALNRLKILTPKGYSAMLHISISDDCGIAQAIVIAEAIPSEIYQNIINKNL